MFTASWMSVDERGEPHLAGVLDAREEVEDLLLLLDDALLLLLAVGDALALEDGVPILVGNLDLVLDRGDVLQLGLLGQADELLDVVPLAPEQGTVVRDRVIRAVRGGNPCQHGKLPRFGADAAFAVVPGDTPHADGQVAPWRVDVEQVNHLDILTVAHGLAPVGVEQLADAAVSLRRGEPAVAGLLADQAHDPRAIGIEDDDRDAEGEVLEVLAHTEEIRGHGVVEQEVLDLLFDSAAARVGVVGQAAAVAHFGIEHLTGGEGLVTLDEVNDVVRHVVVRSPGDIGQGLVDDGGHDVHVLLEHLAAVGLERRRCVEHRDGLH